MIGGVPESAAPATVRVVITAEPLAIPAEERSREGRDGAVLEFYGVVRDTEDGRAIEAIDYECHLSMAQAQLERIARETAARHSLSELIVLHRIGVVPAGEPSLYVRTLAPHRGPALAAVAELIEDLKRDVPIWKHPIERRGAEA
ncbi:MAG: molybdenum cofactor biosynthesis protein MoaE [Candidatus Eisenbacteria bacterium]